MGFNSGFKGLRDRNCGKHDRRKRPLLRPRRRCGIIFTLI